MEGAPRDTVTHKLRPDGSAVYVIGFGTSWFFAPVTDLQRRICPIWNPRSAASDTTRHFLRDDLYPAVTAGPPPEPTRRNRRIMARRIDEDELIEHFTLYPDEHDLLRDKSGVGRLGFSLLLKYLLWKGRSPGAGLSCPRAAWSSSPSRSAWRRGAEGFGTKSGVSEGFCWSEVSLGV